MTPDLRWRDLRGVLLVHVTVEARNVDSARGSQPAPGRVLAIVILQEELDEPCVGPILPLADALEPSRMPAGRESRVAVFSVVKVSAEQAGSSSAGGVRLPSTYLSRMRTAAFDVVPQTKRSRQSELLITQVCVRL